MLVLRRKQGERVLIAGGIVVTVIRLRAGSVHLGFEAPRETAVCREEIARDSLKAEWSTSKPSQGRL